VQVPWIRVVRHLLVGVGLAASLVFAPQLPAFAQSASGAGASIPVASADTSSNPYGIAALWDSSDAITKTVLLLLAAMSMGSWYFLVVKVLEQHKMSGQAKKVAQAFWSAPTLDQAVASLTDGGPYLFIAQSGLDATKKQVGLVGQVPLTDWISISITRSVEQVNSNMQSGLAFLATVGSTSPFVGLFGTVWGIYHALTAIGISGQASIDKVAGPVGEALIMTAIGLAVAVPAVLSYNWLVRRNKAVMNDVRSFGNDLHAVLQSTAAKT
jgi:biopolymer transport protein ExbB